MWLTFYDHPVGLYMGTIFQMRYNVLVSSVRSEKKNVIHGPQYLCHRASDNNWITSKTLISFHCSGNSRNF